MINEIIRRSDRGDKNIASIDIGSHTVRLLVAQKTPPPELFKSLLRKRGYSRLADGFSQKTDRTLSMEAINRAVNLIEDFSHLIKKYRVERPRAMATGIVREAANQAYFLRRIHDKTGIHAKVLSGEEEAFLTKRGVLHSLHIGDIPSIIFDLGGGTTECITHQGNETEIRSLPIGAMILTQRFLLFDPAKEEEIDEVSRYADEILAHAFPQDRYTNEDFILIGSGGTVTTLAAMVNNIPIKDITPEQINGLQLKKAEIEDLFTFIKTLSIMDRIRLPGLDAGRAEVIIAGTLAVLRIMDFFKSFQLTVSYSDLLEGALIEYLQGDDYE